MGFQSNAHIGKKKSNFFNRFYTFFKHFHTFFQIFRNFSTTFDVFKHELARLVLPHFTHLPYLKLTPNPPFEAQCHPRVLPLGQKQGTHFYLKNSPKTSNQK
jgi:hypothetical protein